MSSEDQDKAEILSALLLPKAFDTGDLGLFEAAVNCVVGRGMLAYVSRVIIVVIVCPNGWRFGYDIPLSSMGSRHKYYTKNIAGYTESWMVGCSILWSLDITVWPPLSSVQSIKPHVFFLFRG